MKLTVALTALVAVFSTSAYAKPHPVKQQVPQVPQIQRVSPIWTMQQVQTRAMQTRHSYPRHIRATIQPRPIQNQTRKIADNLPKQNYLPHPDGCPATNFCGCGAAKDLGIEDKDKSLWAAASWFKFPRSAPARNTVAVKQHHVFVLKQDVGNGNWLVADYNSGGHLSRLHVRGLAGFTIVNPLPKLKSFWDWFIG